MMRIISGKYKGKKIKEPSNALVSRPTMDRIKESMFNILQYKIRGAIVLDLFAGSGALGIEALSQGAKTCFFVDNDVVANGIIKENLNIVGATADVLQCDYKEAIDHFASSNIKFDIILLDPPYASDLGIRALTEIKAKKILSQDAVIVFETDRHLVLECKSIFSNVDVRQYGNKQLIFLYNNQR